MAASPEHYLPSMTTRKFIRLLVKALLLISSIIATTLCLIAYQNKEWATIASALTVITAVLAIWTSLNLTWRQEDERQPQLIIDIDNTSHKYAYSLLIKNEGKSPAYNVRINWTKPILDFDGQIPRFTDFDESNDFDVLQPDSNYSRLLIGSDTFTELANQDSPLVYNGHLTYTISPKSKTKIKQDFILSLEQFKKRLNVLNDQTDFYFENKKIGSYLKSISETLKALEQTIGNNSTKDTR